MWLKDISGPLGRFQRRSFGVFGVAETPTYVVDHPLISSTGPNPLKGGFLTIHTLDIVVDARAGQPIEAFTPPGPFHGGF